MNKLTKSAIAGAAGIALLLGGAGSLAYWNNSADVSASTINAGTLSILANGVATTTYTTGGGAVTLIVPGDSVTITQALTVSATGDNLKAALTIDESALLGSLKTLITTPVTVTAFAGATAIGDPSNMTRAQVASITSVKVVVVFPSTVDGSDGQGGDLQLGTLKVKLTQIP